MSPPRPPRPPEIEFPKEPPISPPEEPPLEPAPEQPFEPKPEPPFDPPTEPPFERYVREERRTGDCHRLRIVRKQCTDGLLTRRRPLSRLAFERFVRKESTNGQAIAVRSHPEEASAP
jgi:hypothetical protein